MLEGILRRRIFLFLLAAAIPLLLLSAGLAYRTLQQERLGVEAEATGRANSLMVRVDRELEAQIELLDLLADSVLLDPPQPKLAEFHALALKWGRRLPLWDRVILSDLDNSMVVNTAAPYGTPLGPVVDLEGHRRAIESAQPSVGHAVGPGRRSKDGLPKVPIRVPVIRSGKVEYILVALVSVEAASRIISADAGDSSRRPFLIDSSDTVVAAPFFPERQGKKASPTAVAARAAGNGGIYRGQAPDGSGVVIAFAKSPATGWSAHIAVPLTVYNAPLERAQWIIGAAGGMALLLSGLFVWNARRQFTAETHASEIQERHARLEALGRLTGGVAHDFNNVLMVIFSGIDLIKRRGETGPKTLKYLDAMADAATRGGSIARQLLVFSKGGVGNVETIRLGEHLAKISNMLRQALRGDIALEISSQEAAISINVDPSQLDVALLNLAANSRDAMPDGGKFAIAAARSSFPDASGKKGVAISVSDTGSGIAPDILPRVIEPFFTTKEASRGTGLGLSQVYGFAKASGGALDVKSRIGQGTTVTLYLPEAQTTEQVALDDTGSVREVQDEVSGRILLVDDNVDIRMAVSEHLGEFGYQVRQASQAEQALEVLRSYRPDVLVTDLVMPGEMDGVGLARSVRASWPDLPIVLISGYSESAAAARSSGFAVLPKPFTAEDLKRRIEAEREKMAAA